jgi:hypothetical protein
LSICSKCKKAVTCNKICPKLEAKLDEEIKFTDPDTVNIHLGDGANIPDDLKDDWEYTDYKDKGLGDQFSQHIREFDFESIRKEFLIWAFKNNEKELKKQFIDFLKCNKMLKIAKLCGCTKQNIFKMFQRKIRQLVKVPKICEALAKYEGSLNLNEIQSPRKFKRIFALG